MSSAFARGAHWILLAAPLLMALLVPVTARAQTPEARAAALVAEADGLAAADAAGAEARYREALRVRDGYVPAMIGLGWLALGQEQWGDAGTWADRVLDVAPENLDARYVRAFSNRELARYRTVLQRRHWEGAEKHFEYILAADSLYRDVLYQYARVRHYHEAYEEAIRLGYAQIRLKPELEEPRLGLFQIYRAFVHRDARGALAVVSARASAYDRFFRAELHRLAGEPQQADALLAALEADPAPLPVSAVLLARARLHYDMGRLEAAQAFVDRAIEQVDGGLAARFVMEDFKYLLEDDEWAAFQEVETAEGYRDFFRRFWARRDPMPSLALNLRIAEHYARLRRAERDYPFFGFKTWANSPDKLGELDFPRAYALNEEFNDRGVVFIRHGEPGDRVTAVGGASVPNESWRYYLDPPMDFHFVVDAMASGDNWRLTPNLERGAMLGSRATWGRPYLQAAQADSEIEFYEAERRIADYNRESVVRGLTTESYRWPEAFERVDVPFLVAAFRTPGGRTRLEVHYDASPAAAGTADSLRVEAGYAVVDTAWQTVAEARRAHTLRRDAGPEDAVGTFTLEVAPDSFQVSVHLLAEGEQPRLGTETASYRAPDFGDGAFAMSDLLPARVIRAAARPGPFDRGDLYVLPNPSGTFGAGEPVFVYYELYGLRAGDGGQARYTVELSLFPVERRGGLFGLFGRRDRPALRLRTEHTAAGTDAAEHAEIDVGDVAPGAYRLQVSVTDQARGETVSRSARIELED